MKEPFIYQFLLLLSAVLLTSCGKDDVDDLDKNGQTIKVNNNGHDYVDIGLSVYWATFV